MAIRQIAYVVDTKRDKYFEGYVLSKSNSQPNFTSLRNINENVAKND